MIGSAGKIASSHAPAPITCPYRTPSAAIIENTTQNTAAQNMRATYRPCAGFSIHHIASPLDVMTRKHYRQTCQCVKEHFQPRSPRQLRQYEHSSRIPVGKLE